VRIGASIIDNLKHGRKQTIVSGETIAPCPSSGEHRPVDVTVKNSSVLEHASFLLRFSIYGVPN
jgi:hypothetical protein